MLSLAGKCALVTGAGSGIGEAVAKSFLGGGAIVIAVDVNEKQLKNVFEHHGESRLKLVSADISQHDQVSQLFENVQNWITDSNHTQLNVLVNCAGVTRDNWLLKMDPTKEWDPVLDVNLKGTFLTCQHFANQFISNHPENSTSASVVNISSVVGRTGNYGQTNYAASKAGLIGFTKSAAKELARKNIRVNAIEPGFIDTPMAQAVPSKVLEKMLKDIPLKRLGKVEEVVNMVQFLASDLSSYTTGSTLQVSGGLWM